MTDDDRPDELGAVPAKAAEAAAALEALKEPAERAASAIEDAFGRAGASLTRSLARAAADGEISLAELARAVLGAVGAGLGQSGGGLGAAIAQAVAGVAGFGGARADGGAVTGGGAYLVGERGPEVFRPAGAGTIEGAGGGGVTVNVTVDGGAPALLRSEAQIAQMLARAAALGARRL
ncbi:MAG: phage tail tape measure protein [Pseudomonadota bacterium]